ncbi:MAG: hypothetical protein OXC02_05955 [Rhodobacteraceae bacterium]|nr:hypothetical protein [Paracoccaceae bacterium]
MRFNSYDKVASTWITALNPWFTYQQCREDIARPVLSGNRKSRKDLLTQTVMF